MSMKDIQAELKAPKGQYNKFGTYYYRSCEDIVEAAKPVLLKHDCYLNISDEIVQAGDRIYVKATASVFKGSEMLATSTAFAREPESQKGMSESQITGTASSYARKYALNGLLAIDDTKDADTNEHHEAVLQPTPAQIKAVASASNLEELRAVYKAMTLEAKDICAEIINAAKERLK
jgi:hypothetical protein